MKEWRCFSRFLPYTATDSSVPLRWSICLTALTRQRWGKLPKRLKRQGRHRSLATKLARRLSRISNSKFEWPTNPFFDLGYWTQRLHHQCFLCPIDCRITLTSRANQFEMRSTVAISLRSNGSSETKPRISFVRPAEPGRPGCICPIAMP
jgi:hypothetical protein